MNISGGDESRRFISIIRQSFRNLLRKRRIALFLFSLIVILGGILIGGFLEYLFYLSALAKVVITGVVTASALVPTFYLSRRLPALSFKTFYHQFGKQQQLPQIKDALDLYFDNRNRSSALHRAAIDQNLGSIDAGEIKQQLDDFSKAHPIRRYYRSGLSGVTGMLLILILFSAWQPDAMNRLAHLGTSYDPPNPYEYTIEPGSITLEQGQSFQPRIVFERSTPENLSLAFKTAIEDEYRERNPASAENNEASFTPISLTTNGSYYFVMDGFESEKHDISVQLRPRLEQLSLQVIPPDYTGLDTTSYSYPFSQIQAYEGSTIDLTAVTNKPVRKLSIFRSASGDSTFRELAISDSLTFLHQWEINRTDTVRFNMSDSAGLSNRNEFRFTVDPREDQAPFVSLTEPSENVRMQTAEPLLLRYEAGDDFGLTSASLQYSLQRAFTSEAEKGSVSLDRPAMNREEQFEWSVPALNPKPRDVITYWIEVTDNDAYNGYKSGRSQKMTITFPSVTEYMDELESQEEEVTESLENISDSFEQMEREYNQFKEKLKQNPETDWEQQQQLEQVEEERNKIDKQVEELNQKFEEIRREIEKSQAMSPETMEAYDELQKLMKEIDDPELAEALKKLRESLGQMNPDQMREALENYEFSEEQYKERIKRTMELFKSLKLNSDLDKMAQSLEELAKQEKEISESDQSPARDLKQQQAVQQDLKDLQEQLEELGENAPDKAKEQINKLQENARQQMKETQQDLQENIEQLKEQQDASESDSETRQQQQNIQQQMQQMAQQMNSAKQQMNQQRKQVNAQALKYILYSLLNLSTNQEELTKETTNIPDRSQAFVEKARLEQNISRQFSMLSDSLYRVSSEIPSFSNQINKKKAAVEDQLARTVELLSERDKSNATYAQRQSLGGINELASMVATLLDQLQNQQGGGSGGNMTMQQFIEELQKMSGQQQKLNQQIQDMINDIQGDRLSRDQMDRLNQLSRQQNRIRKQLKELQQSGQLESGDKVLSELERMSEEMEETINDMRGGQLDSRLRERQQNILSRMLNAEDAIQERGKEERREGTTAEEQQQSSPPDITIEELQKRIRKMLNDPNFTEYSEDYQRLIEHYFELLQEEEKEVIN